MSEETVEPVIEPAVTVMTAADALAAGYTINGLIGTGPNGETVNIVGGKRRKSRRSGSKKRRGGTKKRHGGTKKRKRR